MLMGTDVVIPEAKQVQILLRLSGRLERPMAGDLLEGLEESLDAPVLPWCERRGALMPDSEQAESEPGKGGSEDGPIVGTDASRLAESLDGVQDDAEDADCGFALKVPEYQTGAGAVVEEPKDGAFAAAITDAGEIESPDDVWRHGLRPPVLGLATDGGDLVLSLLERGGDKGLADGHLSPTSMQVVEDDRDFSASVVRYQGLEAKHFFVDPRWIGEISATGRGRWWLGPASSRYRPMASAASAEGEQSGEAGEEKRKVEWLSGEQHSPFLPSASANSGNVSAAGARRLSRRGWR